MAVAPDAAAGGGDWKLAAVCLSLLVGIFGALAFLIIRMSQSEGEKPEEQPAAQGGNQRRRGALDRMQRGAARGASASAAADGGEEEEDEADGGDRATRRNAQKQKKKEERRDQQQAERQVRQQAETAKSEKQKKYDQKLQDKEAERQRKEAEDQKAKEDLEKKEQDEFKKWKEMFAIEAEGEAEGGPPDESAVERFLAYVKRRKVVNLEDLAAEFKMKTSAAIDRLEQLQKLGSLSGVFDDRGKYIYITSEEMSAVADWLKKKGRINRPELVAACNRLIRLNPTAEEKAALEREARESLEEVDGGDEAGEQQK